VFGRCEQKKRIKYWGSKFTPLGRMAEGNAVGRRGTAKGEKKNSADLGRAWKGGVERQKK